MMTSQDIENYKNLVDETSQTLLDLCDKWTREIDVNEKQMDEEIVQRIHSVIGKSHLLRTSKFVQFKGFLNDAQGNTIGKPVNSDDIRGFWETIYLQVEQVVKAFAELDELKLNNYVESCAVSTTDGVARSKKPAAVIKKSSATCKKPTVNASSNLRNFISARRQKLNAETDVVPSNGHT